MGGLAGHMSHLYDNPKLTFSKLKKIFIAAAEGELEGTEKTDGQNLYLSFSVPDQKMEFTDDDGPGRAARNKGNIKSGGLTVKQVVDKFADHPNQELKKSFSQALRAFEKVVQSFPREKQVEIFGPDTNIYYNAEIINPDTPNVINYDKKLVTLHRGGGGFFDKETGSPEEIEGRDPETGELVVKERDISANAEILAQALEEVVQDMGSQGGFEVIMDAVQKLQGLEDKAALNKALADLDAKISAEGISDNQMIIEYIMARILTILKERGVKLDAETESLVLKRLILKNKVYRDVYLGQGAGMPRNLAPNKILKDLHPRDKNKVIDVLNNSKDILKQAIQPIENVVHDFSVAMLAGLESLFILDNKKGIEKIRQKVRTAKEKIETEGSKENLNTFLRQMEKLKNIENISTAAEGFVFDYDGHTYKFTGNFAPINQILGIGKYEGRGELPSLEKGEIFQVPRETGLAAKGRMKLESMISEPSAEPKLIPEPITGLLIYLIGILGDYALRKAFEIVLQHWKEYRDKPETRRKIAKLLFDHHLEGVLSMGPIDKIYPNLIPSSESRKIENYKEKVHKIFDDSDDALSINVNKISEEADQVGEYINEVLNIILGEKEDPKVKIIYIPGGFKPPHKGHWNLVEAAAKKYPGVPIRIVTGEKSRDEVGFPIAKQIWDIYRERSGIDVGVINFTQAGAPDPWRWIGSEKREPKSFAIAYSNKDEGYKKIADALSAIPIEVEACQDEDASCPLSATNFRERGLKDRKIFKSFMPTHISDEDEDKIWNILGGSDEEEIRVNIAESIFSIIEEVLEEKESSFGGATTFKGKVAHIKKTKPDIKDPEAYVASILRDMRELDEMASMGGGSAALGAGNAEQPKDKRPKLKGFVRGIKITYESKERN